MASGRLEGIYRIYIENPAGARRLVKAADSTWWNVSGLGSPDGVMSTTATPEKWNVLGLSQDQGVGGYSIVLTAELSIADGCDISDSVGVIPVLVNGTPQTIGIAGGNGLANTNFIADISGADLPAATPVSQEILIFKARAKEGVVFRLGGMDMASGRVFLSLEDDTA